MERSSESLDWRRSPRQKGGVPETQCRGKAELPGELCWREIEGKKGKEQQQKNVVLTGEPES